jgi:hypothetical protein
LLTCTLANDDMADPPSHQRMREKPITDSPAHVPISEDGSTVGEARVVGRPPDCADQRQQNWRKNLCKSS